MAGAGETPVSGGGPPRPPLEDFDWVVRTEAYHYFASFADAPTVHILRRRLRVEGATVVASLRRLHAHHHLALFPHRDEIWMANPFSSVPTDYPVVTGVGRHWASCAWDALGVPAILQKDGWIETRCAGSDEPLAFGVRDGALAGDDAVIHVVVPMARMWDDIGFT